MVGVGIRDTSTGIARPFLGTVDAIVVVVSMRAGMNISQGVKISLVEICSTPVLGHNGKMGSSESEGQEGGKNSEDLNGLIFFNLILYIGRNELLFKMLYLQFPSFFSY